MRKGILLLGGSGTRFRPVTNVINKHFIPIMNRPMFFYSLSCLMISNIRSINIISNQKSIKDIKDDKDEITNRIQSRRALKENGIGMYDENGNLTPEMRQYMNYIINYSLHEGDDSNIQRTKPVIPIELSMTLDGIGGLKPGDMFRVDYLPKVYRDFAYFQIFQVNHSMGTSGWETKITAQMKLDLVKMKKEGYVQTTEPRDFDLGDITEAMRIFYDDDNAAIVFNNTLSQQDQAWNAIIQSQIDKGYKMVGLIPLQALLIDDGTI